MYASLGSPALPTSVRGPAWVRTQPLYVRALQADPPRLSRLLSLLSSSCFNRSKGFLSHLIRIQSAVMMEDLLVKDEQSDASTLYITSTAPSEAVPPSEHGGQDCELDRQSSLGYRDVPASQEARGTRAAVGQRRTGRTSVMAKISAAGLPRAARRPSLAQGALPLTEPTMEQPLLSMSKSKDSPQAEHKGGAQIESWRVEVAQELEREKMKRVSVSGSVAQAVYDVSELFLGSRKFRRGGIMHLRTADLTLFVVFCSVPSVLQSRLARVPDSRSPEPVSVSDDGELELSDYADHRGLLRRCPDRTSCHPSAWPHHSSDRRREPTVGNSYTFQSRTRDKPIVGVPARGRFDWQFSPASRQA